jgi:alpha-beta hydrolase superfamily lysophospholipase
MQHTEGRFSASDGLDLYYQAWLPALEEHSEPKAVFAVVHGYGEHSGRYLNLVSHFAPRGFALYAYDLRGHGKSAGQRGHVNHFEEYLSDTDMFLKLVRQLNPGRKLFLLGHSVGGLIVAAYAESYPTGDLAGLVMSSAFLQMKMKVPGWKMTMARTLSSLLPTFTMANDLGADLLSHDPAVAAAYTTDPLNHYVATARWSVEIFAAQARTLDRAGEVKIPALVIYAGDDQIADPAGSALFFERLKVTDKTVHRYDGYYHEIFNEVGKETVFKDVENWLAERV